jgi:hypothetical protein
MSCLDVAERPGSDIQCDGKRNMPTGLLLFTLVLLKLMVSQLVKQFSAYYGTRRLITLFKTVPPVVPALCQNGSVWVIPSYVCNINVNIIPLSVSESSK